MNRPKPPQPITPEMAHRYSSYWRWAGQSAIALAAAVAFFGGGWVVLPMGFAVSGWLARRLADAEADRT